MPEELEPLEDYSDSPTYRWVIRGLYAAGLALNVYVLWDMSHDEYETAVVRERAVQLWNRCLAPIRDQREWRRKVSWLHWEAQQIVEESTSDNP